MLKLVERALQHVLGVQLLYPQQIEQHIVRHMEGRRQLVRFALLLLSCVMDMETVGQYYK